MSQVPARVGRRALLKGGIGVGVGLSLAPCLAASGQDDQASLRPREGDWLVRDGDAAKTPLTPDDIMANANPTVAWAMDPVDKTVRSGSRFNRLVLVRPGSNVSNVGNVSDGAGVFAFTAICPHDGCDVTDWVADEHLLSCPCHFSKFDPKDGGRVTGGPAPRALPALPLAVADGRLVVAKPFTSRVGFESQ